MDLIGRRVRPRGRPDPVDIGIAGGRIQRIELRLSEGRFLELTGAEPPDDLDDGEAAALAVGETLSLPVALDEAKGRRVARERLPDVRLLSSAEIFAMPEVAVALGAQLVEAMFSALVNARMRVLPDHEEWVRGLLGEARVAQCPSLRRRRA